MFIIFRQEFNTVTWSVRRINSSFKCQDIELGRQIIIYKIIDKHIELPKFNPLWRTNCMCEGVMSWGRSMKIGVAWCWQCGIDTNITGPHPDHHSHPLLSCCEGWLLTLQLYLLSDNCPWLNGCCQPHFWAYTPRKPDLKETRAPQCSSQHCL